MQQQNNTHHQAKVSTSQTPKKPHVASFSIKIIIVLFFGFFINLSLTNERLFLKEILIGIGIICMLLLPKIATKNYTK